MALDGGYSDQILPRQARRAELLDAQTEARLARAWRDQGDTAALHRLVTAYMRLAVAMAAKFRRYGAASPDLTQEAAIGLMKAAERFDPDLGHRFSTYAVWWIKAQLQDYVMRNWSLVRTGSTSGQKALFFNLRRIEARLTREARERGETLEGPALRRAIALDLGVTEAEVAMMEGRLAGSDASLNAPQAGDDEGREWIDALEDDAPQAAEAVQSTRDLAALRRHLAAAMGGLSPRERLIVQARQLTEVPRTLAELGQELNLSKERVRQLEAQAFAKLRRALEAQGAGIAAFLS